MQKQTEVKRKNLKPLWFWAKCPETGKGGMFESDRNFTPKVGEHLPSKMVSDWAEEGDWFVEVVFPRQVQRLISALQAFDLFADGQPLGFSPGSWMAIQEAITRCVIADRKNRRPAASSESVTIEMLAQISAPNSVFIVMTGNIGEPAHIVPATQAIQSALAPKFLEAKNAAA